MYTLLHCSPFSLQDLDEESAEVKCMCRIGTNRFFWPLVEDIIWYRWGGYNYVNTRTSASNIEACANRPWCVDNSNEKS